VIFSKVIVSLRLLLAFDMKNGSERKYLLDQRSQTRGPQEGPMRPANIRKKEDFKRNIEPIGRISQKD